MEMKEEGVRVGVFEQVLVMGLVLIAVRVILPYLVISHHGEQMLFFLAGTWAVILIQIIERYRKHKSRKTNP